MDFLLRYIDNTEFITYLLIGSVTLLVSIKTIYYYQFNEFLAFLFNGKYLLLHNKKELKANFFNSLFYLFFALNASIFLLYINKHLQLVTDFNPSNNIIVFLFVGVNVFFIGKYLIEKIVFETTNLNSFYERIHFQKLTLINYIAIVLFVFNLLLTYIFPNIKAQSLIILLIIIALLYLFSLVFIVVNNQKIILKHWFYFILYLCAFEISPILLGAIWLKTNH